MYKNEKMLSNYVIKEIVTKLNMSKQFTTKRNFMNKLCLILNASLGEEYKHIGTNLRMNIIKDFGFDINSEKRYFVDIMKPIIANKLQDKIDSFIIDDKYKGSADAVKIQINTSQINGIEFGSRDFLKNEIIKEPWFDLYEPCVNIRITEINRCDNISLEVELIFINLIKDDIKEEIDVDDIQC